MYIILATIPILLILIQSSVSAQESENDPCNYHGLNICNSSGQCDDERFDCYTDDCVNGEIGITGQCDGDDDSVYCWDSQQEDGECTSTLLVTNLSDMGFNNNDNNDISTFITSFTSGVNGCDFVDEQIYTRINGSLAAGHFIRYAEGQLKEYDDMLSDSFIPPVWAGGIPAGCIKYFLFDLNKKELYFFGDTFKTQGSTILSDTESNELVKMAEGLFSLNSTEPEFVALDCEDYCPGTSFTEFKNQTYWTWWAPSDATLYPQPSGAASNPPKPEIFEKISTLANKMTGYCRCS
jgi:hypothetical protein